MILKIIIIELTVELFLISFIGDTNIDVVFYYFNYFLKQLV
jgi:hypothetical protein